MSLNIAIVGYGKMGKAVEKTALDRGHKIIAIYDSLRPEDIIQLTPGSIDVVIEFTGPEVALSNFELLLNGGFKVVTGTTGWYEQEKRVAEMVEKNQGSFIYSANFSPGVNMLFQLNEKLAAMMKNFPDYDCFLTEKHHKQKKDAPSGTAIALGKQLLAHLPNKTSLVGGELTHRPPEPNEISVGWTRAGNIIGEHEITFRSEVDSLTLRHEAFNRDGFALGALIAAEWIQKKKGFYNFAQVFS